MNKYSSNINDYRTIIKTLATNSRSNTIAGYCRIDNTRGFNSSAVTNTMSANSNAYDKAYSTSISINNCNVITGYCQIAKDNVSNDIETNNRLRTISDSHNCLKQSHIILPDITGLFVSSNE